MTYPVIYLHPLDRGTQNLKICWLWLVMCDTLSVPHNVQDSKMADLYVCSYWSPTSGTACHGKHAKHCFFNMLMLAFRTYVSEHSRCQDGSNLLALLNSNINISQKSNISKAICIMRENWCCKQDFVGACTDSVIVDLHNTLTAHPCWCITCYACCWSRADVNLFMTSALSLSGKISSEQWYCT